MINFLKNIRISELIYRAITYFLNVSDVDIKKRGKALNDYLDAQVKTDSDGNIIESAFFKEGYTITKGDVERLYDQYKDSINTSRTARNTIMTKFQIIAAALFPAMFSIFASNFPLAIKASIFYSLILGGLIINNTTSKKLYAQRLKSYRSHHCRLHLEKLYPQFLAQKTTVNKHITYDKEGLQKDHYSITHMEKITIVLTGLAYSLIVIWGTIIFFF